MRVIRSRLRDDDEAVIALGNSLHPEFPPQTVEEYRYFADNWPKDRLVEEWVAEDGGELRGAAALFEERSVNPGAYFVSVDVAPAVQRRGTGSALYQRLLDRATEAGATRLYTRCLEDRLDGLAFAEHRGFRRTGKGERLSRLEIATARLEGLEGIEGRLRSEGIRLVRLADMDTDDEVFMHRLYTVDMETHADIPLPEEFAFDEFDVWRRLYVFGYGRSPEWSWVAMHGDYPVGLARLKRSGGDTAWNAYTGVSRSYRGRGIALALKARTIEWSRENGVAWHYTGNEAENQRMLDINVRLGYTMLPREIELRKVLRTQSV